MKNRGEIAASAKILSRRFEKKTCSICNTSNALRIGIFNLPLGGREGGEAFARPKLRIYVSRRGEVDWLNWVETRKNERQVWL